MAEEISRWVNATTQHGRVSRLTERYRQVFNSAAIVSSGLTGLAKKNYYYLLCEEEDDESKTEIACVGAGQVGGF